jgi:acetolactate synthase-1/2/3 large subunit
MKGGEAVVETLITHGVDTAFTVPGESFLYALEGMRQNADKFRVVSVRQEGGGAFMAEAYGKLTGRPAAVFVSRGPGSSNAAIGIHTAMQDSTPMVVFVGHVNAKSMGRESFQEINQHAFFGEVAKAVLSPKNTDDIARTTAEAIRLSMDGRPGPIVVQIPRDVSSMDTDTEIPEPTPRKTHTPDPELINRAAKMIDAAEAPLIIAGEMITNQNASTELTDFAATGSLPVMSAYRRLDVMANSHVCYAGHLEINRFESQLAAIEACDLVVAVGSRLDGITSADETMLCVGKPLVHIYPDPNILARFESDVSIDSDMKPALDALQKKLAPPSAARVARTEELHNSFLAFSQPGNFTAYGDVDLARVIDTMDRIIDQETTIVTDAGSFSRWIHRYRRFERPHTKAGPMSGAMGYSVPGAVGAKLARPDHEVIAFVGDGGFMMTGQELVTAVEQKLPIRIIVCDNAVHGSILAGQDKTFGPGNEIATVLQSPDFAAVAIAYGAEAYTVTRSDDFEIAFQNARAAKGPSLIHLLTDRRDIAPYGEGREAVH